jgi:hypothetical protein
MRTLTLHPSRAIRFTPYAQDLCQTLNSYKRAIPNCTFVQMRDWYNSTHRTWLSEKSISRYYYGCHEYNNGGSFTQVRLGARVVL